MDAECLLRQPQQQALLVPPHLPHAPHQIGPALVLELVRQRHRVHLPRPVVLLEPALQLLVAHRARVSARSLHALNRMHSSSMTRVSVSFSASRTLDFASCFASSTISPLPSLFYFPIFCGWTVLLTNLLFSFFLSVFASVVFCFTFCALLLSLLAFIGLSFGCVYFFSYCFFFYCIFSCFFSFLLILPIFPICDTFCRRALALPSDLD